MRGLALRAICAKWIGTTVFAPLGAVLILRGGQPAIGGCASARRQRR